MNSTEKSIKIIKRILEFIYNKLYLFYWWKDLLIIDIWGLIRGVFKINNPFLDFIVSKIIILGLMIGVLVLFLDFVGNMLMSLLKFYKEGKMTELITGIIVYTFLVSFIIFC